MHKTENKKEEIVKHIKKLTPKKEVLTNVQTGEVAPKGLACLPKRIL